MNERRARGGRAAGIAGGMAAAVRRRQRDREPRVVVYEAGGAPRMIAPSAPGYDELLDAAERILRETGGRLTATRFERGVRSQADDDRDEPATR